MSSLNQSVLVSSGVTVTTASLIPSVNWALSGFVGAAPESLAPIIAGILVALVHYFINRFNQPKAVEAEKPDVVDEPKQESRVVSIPTVFIQKDGNNQVVPTVSTQAGDAPVLTTQGPVASSVTNPVVPPQLYK